MIETKRKELHTIDRRGQFLYNETLQQTFRPSRHFDPHFEEVRGITLVKTTEICNANEY